MKPLSPDWVLFGYVTRAHGIKGALSYQLLHPAGDCLRDGLEIALFPRGFFCITQLLPGNRLLLQGIVDRTEAEKLAKTEIWVRRSDFPDLSDDEVYLADLIGFEAVDTQGKTLGKISGFSDNRAQILVEIDHQILIPFVKPILVKIDELNQQIILDFHHAS